MTKDPVNNLKDIKPKSSLNGKSVSVNPDDNEILPIMNELGPLEDVKPIIEDDSGYTTTSAVKNNDNSNETDSSNESLPSSVSSDKSDSLVRENGNDGNFNSDENHSRKNPDKKTNEKVYDDVIYVKEISPAGKAALWAQDNEE